MLQVFSVFHDPGIPILQKCLLLFAGFLASGMLTED